MGTSTFAVPALVALTNAGHEVTAVVTASPRPSGRGRRILPSPVQQQAERLGMPVLLPTDPNEPSFLQSLDRLGPDVGILAAYGCILHDPLLALPRFGFLNIHPSLLPAYRGAAPIQRALMNGDHETGVTIIVMNRTIDAGDIIAQTRVQIDPDETAGQLTKRLATIGADLIVDSLKRLADGTIERRPQDPSQATYAPKLTKHERVIDWSLPATVIHNQVRALSPEPGATTLFRGGQLLILRSRVWPGAGQPGELQKLGGRLMAGSSAGLLELIEVCPAGGRVQSGWAFANGQRLLPNERLGR